MRRALGSKNKYKFVNGNIKMPSVTGPIFEAWERCNNMVVSWITISLSPQIAQSAVYIDGAQDLWQDLKERFSKGDYFRNSDLLQEIHSIRQGDQSVSAFFTYWKTIWEELDALRPLIPCICDVKCRCESMKNNIFYRESEYVICFLKGLNDQYGTIKAQILLMEPLPSMNKCFSLVIQQERQMDVTITENQNSAINNINTRPHWRNNPSKGTNFNPRPSQESNKYTGRGGGSGGNSGFSNRGLATSSNRPKPIMACNKICTFCGRENNTLETCYFKHGFPPTFKPRQRQMDPAINSSTRQDNTTITISINNYFHSEKDNDQKVVLTFNPTHQINQTSSEEEILLTQDIITLRMIGLAEVHNHLYIFRNLTSPTKQILTANTSVFVLEFDLWHFRLGHPSKYVFDTVCKQHPYVKFCANKVCDTCHVAKQTKILFPTSTSTTIHPFDLVHMDIWGPLQIPSIHGHKYFLTIVDDFTRHTWLFLMFSKAETRNIIINFIHFVYIQYNTHVKTIRSDNGKEFLMSDFYANSGIVHQTSCVETPEQNSIVERKHRHILNVTRSFLFQSHLPLCFWTYVVKHAVFYQ
ncbi:PREDICTED: uncharacterized protein LOC109333936 [Lupinus angustifolius]|uniref:uncharacterized protein LOC109333936 n=1 Tax=Lupinus angustifolius TaxID=3871 RepID=UPI00092E4AC0|nr:PREDICTED: uncharacterized protein LOC109333936 [Lupinus angustifolius]